MRGAAWTLGRRIAVARQKRGFSAEQVASFCRVSVKTWTSWETGRSVLPYPAIVRIADALGVSAEKLMRGGDSWDQAVAHLGHLPTPEWFALPTQFPDELTPQEGDAGVQPFKASPPEPKRAVAAPCVAAPARAAVPQPRVHYVRPKAQYVAPPCYDPPDKECVHCGAINMGEDRLCFRCCRVL